MSPPLGAAPTADTLERRRPAGWPPPGSRALRLVLVALLAVPVILAVPRLPATALRPAGVAVAYAHPAPAEAAAAGPSVAPLAPAPDARPSPDEGDGRPTPPSMPSVELPAGWGWVADALWGVLDALFRAYLERASLEAQRELDRFWELGLPEYATRLAGRLLWSALWVTITFWDAALSRLCCADWKVLEHTAPQLTYAHPAVRSLHATLLRVANLAVAAVVLVGGLGVMVRRHLGEPLPDAAELLPRVLVAVLLANTALLWGGWLIELNNALCRAVALGDPFPRWGERALADRLAMEAIAYAVYLVMGVLLLLQNLARLAVVDLLLVTAPPALLCWALPLTEGWARLWAATFGRVVFTQFVQAVLLKLGAGLTGAWVVGLGAEGRGLGGALLWIAVLWVTFRVPALLRAGTDARVGIAVAVAARAAARRLA
jgi:hypothetical protein